MWRQITHKMATKFVVAMITSTAELRSVLSLARWENFATQTNLFQFYCFQNGRLIIISCIVTKFIIVYSWVNCCP